MPASTKLRPPAPEALAPFAPLPNVAGADVFDLRTSLLRIWEACRMHAWIIILTPVLAVALVVAYVAVWPPVYSAQAVLLAEPENDTTRDHFYYFWNTFRKEDVKSEVSLITSNAVVVEVVRKLGLTYDDVYHPFLSHAAYLWTESSVGKVYRKVKRWIFPPAPSPYVPTEEQVELAQTVVDFKKGVSIEPVPDSHVGLLILKGPSPRVAEIANTLIDVSLAHRRARYIEEATHAHTALKEEVERVQAELTARENARKQFYSDHDLYLDFEKEKVEIGNLAALEAAARELRSELEGKRQRRERLAELIALEPDEHLSARTIQANPLRQEVEGSRIAIEAKLAEYGVRYQANAPEIQDLKARAAALDEVLMKMDADLAAGSTVTRNGTREQLILELKRTEADIAMLEATLQAKEGTLGSLQARMREIPAQVVQLHHMGRDEAAIEKKYVILKERLMMAEVSIAAAKSAPAAIKVIDYAQPPSKPEWPKTKLLILVAGAVGLFAGTCAAVGIDLIAGRVTESRLRNNAARYPLLAIIHDLDRTSPLDLRVARLQRLTPSL